MSGTGSGNPFGGGSIFGTAASSDAKPASNIFGAAANLGSQQIFGSKQTGATEKVPVSNPTRFGAPPTVKAGTLFGSQPSGQGTSSGVFGTGGGTIFGSSTNKEQDAKAPATPKMPRPDLFGTPTPPQASKQGIFGAKTSSTSQEPAPPSIFKNPFAKSIQPLDGGSTATFGKPEQPASIFSGSGGGGGGGITIKRPDFLSNKPKPEAAPVFAKPSPIRNPFGASNPNAPAPRPAVSGTLFGAPLKGTIPSANPFAATTRPPLTAATATAGGVFGAKPPMAAPQPAIKGDIRSRLGKRPAGASAAEPAPKPAIQAEEDEAGDEEGGEEEEEEGEIGEEEEEEGDVEDDPVGDEDYDPAQDEQGGVRHLERLTSREELMSIKSIICENVPSILLKQPVLTKHFSKFGEVSRVNINAEAKTATIQFKDHKAAKKAKAKGHSVTPNAPPIGDIFFTKTRRSSEFEEPAKPGFRFAAPAAKKPLGIFGQGGAPGGGEVNEELQAMAATSGGLFSGTSAPAPRSSAPATKSVFQIKRPPMKLASKPVADPQPATQLEAKAPGLKVNRRELMEVLKRQALTDFDKFEVLEARDRLVRDARPTKDGKTKLVGSCPDICPEKERYSRSAKNQLRFYEKMEGSVHHKAVVKEYSRSSADQDVPLSHDLRPASVLKTTMDHLLCNVICRIDDMRGTMTDHYEAVLDGHTAITSVTGPNETVGDWFEYVWSTTRGIRKDLTQQDMTSLTAVDLVEKCARFHIVCSERLVEVDSHDFDKKLNDENLTKCIQTLKHMYYDLSIQGLRCPNEPEFRAYDVLLKLNDGDTLRSVQTELEVWVRQSPEMGFALKVFSALNNNNYVKFFKLVRQSTLLQGCILLRYFHQVRRKALETIVNAYCPKKGAVIQYPLSRVSEMLAFEDLKSCAIYCRMHGLESEGTLANSEDSILFLEKGAFFFSEEIPAVKRALVLVESKKLVSWSEVVNGGPLPTNPFLNYQPHSSFDDNGYLKRSAYDASDQSSISEGELKLRVESEKKALEIQARLRAEEIASKNLVDVMTEQVVQEMCQEVARGTVATYQMDLVTDDIADSLIEEGVGEIVQSACQEVMRGARNEELQRRLKEEEEMAESEAAQDVANDLISETAKDLLSAICVELMGEVDRVLRVRESMGPDLLAQMVDEVVSEDTQSIVGQALVDAERERLEKVEALRKKSLRTLKTKVFNGWRHWARKSSKHRQTVANFPSTPANFDLATQTKMLAISSSELERRRESFPTIKERLAQTKQLDLALAATELQEEFAEKMVMTKLDWPVVASKSGRSLKILLVVPTRQETEGLCAVLKHKFSGQKVSEISRLPDDDGVITCQPVSESIALCVRVIQDQQVEELAYSDKKRRDYLWGTTGVVYLGSGLDDISQLEAVLEKLPSSPPVPLCLLDASDENISSHKTATVLTNHPKVSNMKIFSVSRDIYDVPTLTNIHKCAEWLTDQKQTVGKKLEASTLEALIKDFLDRIIFGEIRATSGQTVDPNAMIKLYNGGIDFLITKVLAKKELRQVSLPIAELKHCMELPNYWNDPSYLAKVKESLEYLKLPMFSQSSSAEENAMVGDYFTRIERKTVAFNPVTKAKLKAKLASRRKSGPMPWADIIITLVEYKLAGMPTKDSFSGSESAVMVVSYFTESLGQFELPKDWLRQRKGVNQPCIADPRAKIVNKKTSLTDIVAEERQKSLEFEARLKSALKRATIGDENDDTDIPPAMNSRVEEVESTAVGMEGGDYMVPVIGFLSPTLAAIAAKSSPSPNSILMQRVSRGNLETGSGSKRPRIGGRQRHSLGGSEYDASPTNYSHSKSRIMKELKDTVREDLNQSSTFDKKLHEAVFN